MSNTPKPSFKVGDVVALRSNPDTLGSITGILPSNKEPYYSVFVNGGESTFYESQLQEKPAKERVILDAGSMRAYLTSLHLLSHSLTSLYSLRSGRIQFVPYQYRPVLRLIRSDRPRLLIADEVGVGKTIEAGLIIKELRARMDIKSVLVLCPKVLVAEQKWEQEMKRFDEDFTVLNGSVLRHCLKETEYDGAWPEKRSLAIIPFSLFDSNLLHGRGNRGNGLIGLDPPPEFDLVIVDEAHHIRNQETYLHQAVRYFCDNAKAAVFLTATPVQLSSKDLFSLLNVLRPDVVIDQLSFELMSEPNMFINQAVSRCRTAKEGWLPETRACMEQAVKTDWGKSYLSGSPLFKEVKKLLSAKKMDDEARVKLSKKLEELGTFSRIINRTRRRDIGEFTTRRPTTLEIEFTEEQRRFYENLIDITRRVVVHYHGQQNVNLIMSTVLRQAASCLYGLVPMLERLLTGRVATLEMMVATDKDIGENIAGDVVEQIKTDVENILSEAKSLPANDPKAAAFMKALKDKAKQENNKSLVYSTFLHTLSYLEKLVEKEGLRYGIVHGKVSEGNRSELRRRFALHKDETDALDVLLSSEIGGEGLDFQFCDLLINYDLPWNPMRIEQRIGRIDRYGQKSKSVAIINMITKDTIDAMIYERCLQRIGVFEHSVGGSEAILGNVTKEIHDIAENYTLTQEEQEERLRQASDNAIRLIQEENELEDKQVELFGLQIPESKWRNELKEAENFWLSPKALEKCVSCYISKYDSESKEHFMGSGLVKNLRLDKQTRGHLLTDSRTIEQRSTPSLRNWEKWLKGTEPNLQVSFESDDIQNATDMTFLNVIHPLVRQAAMNQKLEEAPWVVLTATSDTAPLGKHYFSLYHWQEIGVRKEDKFVAVTTEKKLDKLVMKLLETADEGVETAEIDKEEMGLLEARHYEIWNKARQQHKEANNDLVKYRRNSQKIFHDARCKSLQSQINEARDERIRRMRQSELDRANLNWERQREELDIMSELADIHTNVVLRGIIEVIRPES